MADIKTPNSESHKYPLAEMDLDCERSFVALEASKQNSRQQSSERLEEDKHYTVILNEDEKGYLDPNARIILLNQHCLKFLSVIPTKKKFLPSVQKFTSP